MKNLKKNKLHMGRSVVVPVLIFSVLICILIYGASHFREVSAEQELALTEQAIRRAVLQCYAIEGMYPSSLDYLTEHYNLDIDEEKYFISYDCFASNIIPQIFVFERD